MTVRELNQNQLEELKTNYFYAHLDDDYSGQCDGYDLPWEIPNEVIFEYYDGINFVEEDFFCSKGGLIMKIIKVYPAGWKMEMDDKTIYFGEYGKFGCYCNDGVVYKDRQAFETGQGVCYINEYGFDNDDENAGPLFEFSAKEAIASELEGNSYTATEGYTRADLEALCNGTSFDAEDVFDHLDWMSPETLIDEWVQDEEENT